MRTIDSSLIRRQPIGIIQHHILSAQTLTSWSHHLFCRYYTSYTRNQKKRSVPVPDLKCMACSNLKIMASNKTILSQILQNQHTLG